MAAKEVVAGKGGMGEMSYGLAVVGILISLVSLGILITKISIACDRIKDIHEWMQENDEEERP